MPVTDESFSSRRVLVIGVGGIGQAVADRLASSGAQVFGTFHHNPASGSGSEGGGYSGSLLGAAACDVTEASSVQAVAGPGGAAEAALGAPPDIVVVTSGHRHAFGMLTDLDPSEIHDIVHTELLGPLHVVRSVLPGMKEVGFGRIVLIGSDSGKAGTLGDAASSAARAGLLGLARSVARETALMDITINVVSAGPTDTGLFAGMLDSSGLTGKVMRATLKAVPKARPGSPAEVAEAVVYFAGPQSGFTTGQVLSVSGGLTMA